MTRSTDIVVTTIYEPAWLAGYLDNLRAHGRQQDVGISIIVDQKTPATAAAAAHSARAQGFDVWCPTLDEQTAYLDRLGAPAGWIPWNTDNRRNIGFLRAAERHAEVLISIDDDNYCLADSDFVGCHHVVGRTVGELAGTQWAGGKAWYNICERLQTQGSQQIFARGFPYESRRQPTASLGAVPTGAAERIVAINAGLWTDDPDVDALTRLTLKPRVLGAQPAGVVLAPETWSPINTQNTALIGAALPAYYYVRMGFPLQGLRIDRFGDILSGYFVQACAKHLGHVARIGDPVAEHRRSQHNLFKDLYFELAGVVLVEDLLPWLQELKLSGASYAEAYAALADALEAHAPSCKGFVWDEGGRDFLRDTAACMRTWLGLLERFR
ncbi:MAG TPA: hypothetical protein VM074_03900 [Solimonas sp.]|nr:hypothetical protein [Solimonas sp.]